MSNPDEILLIIKARLRENFVDPEQFKMDLNCLYISSFFCTELRKVFTEKERKSFLFRQNIHKPHPHCSNSDNVTCFKVLSRVIYLPEKYEVTVFKTKDILSGIKLTHFFSHERLNKQDSHLDIDQSGMLDALHDSRASPSHPKRRPVYEAERVLVDRERHTCAMARKRLSTRERRLDLAERIKSAEDHCREVVERWVKSPKVLGKDGVMESGASAARRETEEVSWVNPNEYSFDEDDKTITDMLDSIDNVSNLVSPKEDHINRYFDMKGSNQKVLPDHPKPKVQKELDDFELFMQESDTRSKANTNVRKIELEMNKFGDENLFERLEDQNEDDLWVTMNNQFTNKFNILSMIQRHNNHE